MGVEQDQVGGVPETPVQQQTPPSGAEAPSPVPGGLERSLGEAAAGLPLEGAPAPAAPAPAEWQGVRDYAKAQGVELPFGDDVAALQGLLAAYRQGQQRDYYSDLGRRVAPHADGLAEFLRSRQQQQAPQQQPPPWAPPPFRKEWLQQVERDSETGTLRARAGYDPTLAERVQAYADWRERFLDAPEQVIAPLVDDRARKLIREELGQHQQQVVADSLVAQSAAWMFQGDPQGNPTLDAQGRRQLSPAGQLYATAANDLWQSGVRDVRKVHALARTAVENAVLRQQLLALQPPPTPGAAAAAPTSVGGGATRPSGSAPPAPANQHKGLSLREQLNASLRSFPEETFA